jgi:hypothetical protein
MISSLDADGSDSNSYTYIVQVSVWLFFLL